MDIWQVKINGYPHTQAFDMVALCLRESIRDLGFESNIVHEPTNKAIVLGAHLLEEIPEDCIIYNLEQITSESPLIKVPYLKALTSHRVWDYSKRNIEALKKFGVNAIHMPIGYHPVLTRIEPQKSLYIDCLFYGSWNERRAKIIESVGATPIFNVYGDALDQFIGSSKMILNCHYYETKLFEIVRCSYLLANKKFIISEPGLDTELEQPFKEGIAFHEDLGDAAKYYLKRPDIIEDISQRGFEIFSQMKQTEYLKNESQSW